MQFLVSLLVLAFATTALPLPAAGQQATERFITVVGEGAAGVVPDIAVIQAGVTTQGKTARTASEANSKVMAEVHAALKASGIAERDVQTSQFSIRPVRDSRREGDNRIVGFQATNQVSVNIRAIPRLATVLDQMIAAGANDVSGIHFTVSQRSTLLDKARAEAVADAKRKAEVLAKAAGVRLGRATAIVETSGQPIPMERMSIRAAPAASVPIAVGEQNLQVQVSVTFELLH